MDYSDISVKEVSVSNISGPAHSGKSTYLLEKAVQSVETGYLVYVLLTEETVHSALMKLKRSTSFFTEDFKIENFILKEVNEMDVIDTVDAIKGQNIKVYIDGITLPRDIFEEVLHIAIINGFDLIYTSQTKRKVKDDNCKLDIS